MEHVLPLLAIIYKAPVCVFKFSAVTVYTMLAHPTPDILIYGFLYPEGISLIEADAMHRLIRLYLGKAVPFFINRAIVEM